MVFAKISNMKSVGFYATAATFKVTPETSAVHDSPATVALVIEQDLLRS
jgi:hypothetical protein